MVRTLCSVLCLAALTATVQAQSSSAQAEALFREGKQLMAAKKYAEACAAFEASHKIDPSIATLLNQADCREQNGQLTTAWGLFLDAARMTRSATDRASKQMHNVASQRAAKLEPKLSKLTIVVAPDAKPPGLQITRNSTPVDPGAWNRTLPVDGGSLTISAKAPGRVEWTTTITIGNSADTKSVTIPKLAEVPAEPMPASTVTATQEDLSAEEVEVDDTPSAGSSKVLPIGLGAAAVALLGGAVAFELSGRSSYDEAKNEPDDAKQKSLWESANRKRYIAQGMTVAGVACAGVAVWLFVRSSGETEPTVARGVSIEPMFASGGGGLVLRARY